MKQIRKKPTMTVLDSRGTIINAEELLEGIEHTYERVKRAIGGTTSIRNRHNQIMHSLRQIQQDTKQLRILLSGHSRDGGTEDTNPSEGHSGDIESFSADEARKGFGA
jgi:hypothetical protein